MRWAAGVFGLLFFVADGWASPELDAFPLDRYAGLWRHSPFIVATVSETANVGFAQNLVLTGIARIGKKEFASVLDRQSQGRFLLSPAPNASGISLVEIRSDADPFKTRVLVRKGEESALLAYDPALAGPLAALTGPALPASTPNGASYVVPSPFPQVQVRRVLPIPTIPPPSAP